MVPRRVRLAAMLALALLVPGRAAAADVELVSVVTGLSSPVFVGHAGDGSGRLFIVEQRGVIRVLQPGASAPTPFLDIQSRVVAGGEQGLLGLAFHPQYSGNGRFFVFYTAAADGTVPAGTIVVSEYRVSSDRDVADPTETRLLTIPHPTNTNHNGGMLAFGPDGYLYIGIGDGGSANDPPANAQNVDALLGKILRIDVDPPAGSGVPYLSPPTNPFHGAVAGRDEIFALGWRNPWRFSFDRLTGQQWVGDVGQGQREEVDTPVVSGGNYGWRVYEGTLCTNNDAALCNAANYLSPRFEYGHTGGRCSITGGYVYRGSLGTLPAGTYVYGDYCSGEIFTWDGATQRVLLDTALNVSSFGEDEVGELYVVGLGGSVSRLMPCAYTLAPTSASFASAGGAASVTVTAGGTCGWSGAANDSWIHVTSGSSATGDGTLTYTVDVMTSASARTGTMTIAGRTFTVDQAGASAACTYTLSRLRATLSNAGGTGHVTVTTTAGCAWTAVSNVDWITVSDGASIAGTGRVTYTVAPYTGRRARRLGTMTVAGQTFTVKQTR